MKLTWQTKTDYAQSVGQKNKKTKRELEAKATKDEVTAKLEAAGITLPELIGTEKQVAWALQIRQNVITALTKKGISWAIVTKSGHPENLQKEIDKLFNTSAKYWIDAKMNRETIIKVIAE